MTKYRKIKLAYLPPGVEEADSNVEDKPAVAAQPLSLAQRWGILFKLEKGISEFRKSLAMMQKEIVSNQDADLAGINHTISEILRELGDISRQSRDLYRRLGLLENLTVRPKEAIPVLHTVLGLLKKTGKYAAIVAGITMLYRRFKKKDWDKEKRSKLLLRLVRIINNYRETVLNTYTRSYIPKIDELVFDKDLAKKDREFLFGVAKMFGPNSRLKRLTEQLNRDVVIFNNT